MNNACSDIQKHYGFYFFICSLKLFFGQPLERSATSIGANIRETNYVHGKNDFIAKLQIALKECYETEYWIELFVKAEIIDREIAKGLYNECGTIRKILISSINTSKKNQQN